MSSRQKNILVIDTVIERPNIFKVSDAVFYIYPITLGKMFLMQRITEEMGVGTAELGKSMTLGLLRIVREKRDACCDLLAYMTAKNDYYSVFDVTAFEERKALLSTLDDSELATIVTSILTENKTEEIIKHLGIDREQRNMEKVMKVKNKSDKNSFSFGGVSIFGSLLDVAMERYKMSKRQVVWEIDYTSLRLLLADKVNTIYVTDEERRRIHITKDTTRVNGDDKKALIKAIKSQTWE